MSESRPIPYSTTNVKSLFIRYAANTNQDTNMLIEMLKGFVPCVHGVPDEDQQQESGIVRFSQHLLPIDALTWLSIRNNIRRLLIVYACRRNVSFHADKRPWLSWCPRLDGTKSKCFLRYCAPDVPRASWKREPCLQRHNQCDRSV